MLNSKLTPKKLLVSATLLALLCFSFVSTALAQTIPEDRSPVSGDSSPAADNPEGLPVLIQQQDRNPTSDNSTAPSDAQTGDESSLIATNTAPDNTALVVGGLAVALAVAVGASVVVIWRRKK
jgi:hypothetical protein